MADIIKDFADDIYSLKACSLISAAFCPPTQRHIFKSIGLYREDCHDIDRDYVRRTPGTIQKGFLLLQNSPGYIRDLSIDLPYSAKERLALEHVIGTLSTLHSLEWFVIAGHCIHWQNVSVALKTSIMGILAQPTLSRLHILDIRALPAVVLLRTMSSVTVFSLCSTQFAEVDISPDELDILASARCEHLILGYSSLESSRTSELLLSSRASWISRITRLSIYVDTCSRLSAERLLAATSVALQQLDLDYHFSNTSHPLRLPRLPQLRVMEVQMYLSGGIRHDFPDAFFRHSRTFPNRRADCGSHHFAWG
ncbi:hypothetical protein C8J57DRAFT_1611272 [Mycena rebaudengoi]|nr:hypothetical protein C8J57DRAFT_1611272 [Mycena rebaudengoi]